MPNSPQACALRMTDWTLFWADHVQFGASKFFACINAMHRCTDKNISKGIMI